MYFKKKPVRSCREKTETEPDVSVTQDDAKPLLFMSEWNYNELFHALTKASFVFNCWHTFLDNVWLWVLIISFFSCSFCSLLSVSLFICHFYQVPFTIIRPDYVKALYVLQDECGHAEDCCLLKLTFLVAAAHANTICGAAHLVHAWLAFIISKELKGKSN